MIWWILGGMALIFDRFKTEDAAKAFAAAVKEKGRDSEVFTDVEEAANAAYFPFQLDGAAVVLVDRETDEGEAAIIALVKAHGGEFAGT